MLTADKFWMLIDSIQVFDVILKMLFSTETSMLLDTSKITKICEISSVAMNFVYTPK